MPLETAQMMVLGRYSRQRVSRIGGGNASAGHLLPEGLTLDGQEFGTTSTCLAFKQLRTPAGNFDGWRPHRDLNRNWSVPFSGEIVIAPAA
jgi:hypothetical protein